MYKKQERVFDAVKECVQKNIALHVSHLKEQLLQSNGDNIAIMDSFWFHLHRSILTTASLLVYVSQYDKKWVWEGYLTGRLSVLDYATKYRVPVVIASTGLTDEQLHQIAEASKVVPIFRSGNMSLGIALLRALAKKAAGVLGDAFDVEIVEAHHNRKLDAPSGSALMLLDAVKSAYPDEREAVFGRHGRDCKRQHQEIGMHSLRGGTVTGEHEVCFFGTGERIRISHSAENRGVFAAGALRAAAFLMNQQPGMYSMDDVVGQL